MSRVRSAFGEWGMTTEVSIEAVVIVLVRNAYLGSCTVEGS